MNYMETIKNTNQSIALDKIKKIVNEVLEKNVSERDISTYSCALTRIYNVCIEYGIK